MPTSLDTVVTIPIVAFDDRDSIDTTSTSAVIERMVSNGVTALTANGNTGEFYSLSAEERRTAVRMNTELSDRAEVVAGIGLDVATARADGEFAVAQGCTSLMIHHPPHPFVSPEGWVEYNAQIAGAFDDVPVIPYVKSPNIPHEAVLRLVDRCPNISAVKYAVEDPHAFGALAAESSPRIDWICGVAEMWAPAFWAATGRSAFTSGLANVVPALSLDLHSALSTGDHSEVQRLWHLVRPFEVLRNQHASKNNVSVVKEALAQLGLISPAVRAPIGTVDAETSRTVTTFLENAGSAGYLELAALKH